MAEQSLQDVLRTEFDESRLAANGPRQDLVIGDERLALLYQSSASRSLLGRAFEHVEIATPAVQLLKGEVSTLRVGLGDGFGSSFDAAKRIGIDSTGTADNATTLAEQDSQIVMTEPEALTWWDHQTRAGGWWLEGEPVPLWLRAAPMLQLLHIWGAAMELALIHGAAVGVGDRMALLGARGGVGKSTLAVAALLQGMDFCGDDYLMIDACEQPQVHSLFATAKLDQASQDLLPGAAGLEALPGIAERGRTVFDLADHSGVTRSGQIAAVVIPVRGAEKDSRLLEIGAPEALRAVAVTTVLQLVTGRESALRSLAKVCSAVPCYRLELGSQPSQAAILLAELLA